MADLQGWTARWSFQYLRPSMTVLQQRGGSIELSNISTLPGKILMDELNECNVDGSLVGLGQFILLEILYEMTIPQDANQFLVKESQGKQQGMKFIHSDENNYSTIAIDPVVSEGIVRFEVVFENSGDFSSLGIADASCSFAAGKGPWEDGKKTVRYYQSGYLDHITEYIIRNRRYKDGQRISAIVDMTSNPRKVVFYIDDIEQPNYVIGIPSEIRFWALTYYRSSSFTVTKFERLVQFTQQEVVGSKALQWGKSWK
ncbi:MAG: hypothetical protein EZS28_001028 [Streblomastix strix]|uniref:SPRY domain-containing protein n=1 Tax=Streblomastix strix TaxID=222440 RepID=A0A5J4X9E8_9EUKA|nr:MAG: hypothetical protein EZS28_001028 [Streblomastix strix]